MNKIKKYFPLFFLLLGFMFLGIILYKMNFLSIWEKIKNLKPTVFLILLAPIVWYFFYTYGWLLTIESSIRPKFYKMFFLMASYFGINMLTPFLAIGGEFLRLKYLGDWIGKKNGYASIFSVSIIFHSSTLVFAILGIFALIAFGDISPGIRITFGILGGILVIVIVLMLFLSQKRFFERIVRLIQKIPSSKIKEYIEERISHVKDIDEIIYSFFKKNKKDFFLSYLFHLLGRSVGILEVYIIFYSMGISIDLFSAFIIVALIPVMNLVAFFIPYQMGIEEGNLYILANILGLDPVATVTMGIVRRFRLFVWMGISVIIMYLIQKDII